MSSDKVEFQNLFSGETLVHRDRKDSKRDLKFGETGTHLEGHVVLDQNGIPSFIRDTDGRVIADDSL